MLEFTWHFTTRNCCQTTVKSLINAGGNKTDRTVSKDKLRPAGVRTAEVIEVQVRVIRRMIGHSQNPLESLFTFRDHSRPRGIPAQQAIRTTLTHHQRIAGAIRDVSNANSAVVEEDAITHALTAGTDRSDSRIVLAAMQFLRPEDADVVGDGKPGKNRVPVFVRKVEVRWLGI